MPEEISVLIVDDHPMVRDGMAMLLDVQASINVVGAVGSAQEAIDFIQETTVMVILMDLSMPDINGIEATKVIKTINSDIQIIVLTSHHEDSMVFPAIKAGALSYLLKSTTHDALVDAIRAASKGEARLHASIAKKLMEEVTGMRPSLDTLTPRELEVLKEIANGRDNRNIANHLDLSERTVKKHVGSILSKLYLHDRTQAAIYALRQGLVPLDELE